MLALLKAHNAKGTFFVLGELAKGRQEVIQRIVQAGHEVESHTYTHTNFAKVPEATGIPQLTESIQKTQDIVEQAAGRRPTFVRLPHGIDRPWIREVAKQQGVVLANWTFGYDWFNQSKEDMTRNYVRNIRPGVIILMHDGGKRQKTVDVLEALLKALDEQGYQTVTMSELLETYPPTPAPVRKKKG
jgi:peptidoglycan/xylan/chitin deacetylase (PgdA/CDA1 family)